MLLEIRRVQQVAVCDVARAMYSYIDVKDLDMVMCDRERFIFSQSEIV